VEVLCGSRGGRSFKFVFSRGVQLQKFEDTALVSNRAMATRAASCAMFMAFGSICATGDPVRVTSKISPAFMPVWQWRLAEKPSLHVRGAPRCPQTHTRANFFGAKRVQDNPRVALRQEGGAGEAERMEGGLQSDYQTSHPEQPSFAESTAGDFQEKETFVAVSRSHLGCKTIGVDHGRKRTGVCVSVGYAPRPLPLICHDDNSTEVALQVARIVQNEGAEQIVVGFPFNSTGGEGEQAQYTRLFVTALQKTCPTSAIYLWDERFSTSVARDKLQQV